MSYDEIREKDEQALYEAFPSLKDDEYAIREDWFNDAGRLTILRLEDREMFLKFPQSLFKLTGLVELNLAGTRMEGPIPEAISALVNLKDLNLSCNNITGCINDGIAKLTNLRDLNLYNNQLTGPIPDALSKLVQLRELYLFNLLAIRLIFIYCSNLSSNLFSGPLPSSLSSLSHLKTLKASNNKLTGAIPDSYASLDKLVRLHVDNNMLSGELPRWIEGLLTRPKKNKGKRWWLNRDELKIEGNFTESDLEKMLPFMEGIKTEQRPNVEPVIEIPSTHPASVARQPDPETYSIRSRTHRNRSSCDKDRGICTWSGRSQASKARLLCNFVMVNWHLIARFAISYSL
ncbi:hypothetical protein BC829DRAFT_436385 [Chytridium lagenaria]|nr:hypothetical protein BC829DRAFT_436385 [Chytridium lagenaria]